MNWKTLHTAFLALCFASVSMVGAAYHENGKDTADMDTAKNGMQNGAMMWQRDTVTATVAEVMPDLGMVVLEGPKGNKHTLKVGQNVNLQDFKQGDSVQVELFAARGMQFEKPTEQDRRTPFVIEETVNAPEGTKPMAGELRRVRALVTVTNVDKADSTVTIQGPMGRSFVLTVDDPALLDRVRQGQEFVAVYTEGIVASITKKQKQAWHH
ncbi:MAG: hypothetical protein GF331_23620 [Chitinivibrionales bacterium]|nr:hypothetical protein [Chitinivibrionales bacterium]